jgi:hypothetical protein
MKNFKSAIPVGELGQYATALVVIGVIIGIGGLILLTMDDTSAVSPITYYNDTTVSVTNDTYIALTQPRVLEIISIGNKTAAGNWGLGNVTTIITNRTASSAYFSWPTKFTAGQTMWVYYTYSADSDTSNTLTSTYDAIGTFSDWLGIIAIVIVAVVVLSLIKYL